MPTSRVNGADLYYEVAGSGRPALFIHGMCGNANVWDGQASLLSDELRCVTYDRRGHTRSSLGEIETRTVELHADDAAGLIEALGLAPCLVIASSGGARIGVDLIRRYPHLVPALSSPSRRSSASTLSRAAGSSWPTCNRRSRPPTRAATRGPLSTPSLSTSVPASGACWMTAAASLIAPTTSSCWATCKCLPTL